MVAMIPTLQNFRTFPYHTKHILGTVAEHLELAPRETSEADLFNERNEIPAENTDVSLVMFSHGLSHAAARIWAVYMSPRPHLERQSQEIFLKLAPIYAIIRMNEFRATTMGVVSPIPYAPCTPPNCCS